MAGPRPGVLLQQRRTPRRGQRPTHLRAVVSKAGLDPRAWTPRELRHSFVSLMSAAGVPLEEIARLVGHRSTSVTEAVYRKQLKAVRTEGAEAMDRIFGPPATGGGRASETGSLVKH